MKVKAGERIEQGEPVVIKRKWLTFKRAYRFIGELKPSWAKRYDEATMVKNPSEMVVDDNLYHRCNCCGYIMSDVQMTSVRYDYGCSRCGNSFLNFIPYYEEDLEDCHEI